MYCISSWVFHALVWLALLFGVSLACNSLRRLFSVLLPDGIAKWILVPDARHLVMTYCNCMGELAGPTYHLVVTLHRVLLFMV